MFQNRKPLELIRQLWNSPDFSLLFLGRAFSLLCLCYVDLYASLIENIGKNLMKRNNMYFFLVNEIIYVLNWQQEPEFFLVNKSLSSHTRKPEPPYHGPVLLFFF